jgi:hypothetical protein
MEQTTSDMSKFAHWLVEHMQLDIFEPALESLGDERTILLHALDALQASLAQGPESAGRLRAAVGKLYNDHAETVFRMVTGYSSEGLATGGAADLVEGLSSSSMAVRVLAFENLRRITGKTYQFRPEFRPELEKSK